MLGVGGQVVRVGLAAFGIHTDAPSSDLCFRRTDRPDGRYYEVCDRNKFNDKINNLLSELETFRAQLQVGIATVLHESLI